MAVRQYKANLSVKSINRLKKDLINYRDNILQQKINLLSSRLAELGVSIAKAQIVKYDAIFTSELINSIHSNYGGGSKGTAIFYIVADSEHAVFVEFGTGQVGQSAPYPYPLPSGFSWEYNTGKTIFEISPGQYGWFYRDDNGEVHFTQGMPSRPFMYETAMELHLLVEKVAKEIFR